MKAKTVQRLVIAAAKKNGGICNLARTWGLTEGYMSRVARGLREPGDVVLRKLRLRRVVSYHRINGR